MSATVDYRFDGLTEVVLRVDVAVGPARRLVPAHYRLDGEASGSASLVAAFASVESVSVEGSEPRRGVVSEYGVFVEAPDGTPGRHAYLLWQLSDSALLVERMRATGLPGHLAVSELAAVTDSGRVRIAAQTSWQDAPSRLTAVATEPGHRRGATTPGVRFWHDGPNGAVRVAYECPDCLPRTAATGEVSAAPGTVLDDILGGVARPGSGFFLRADLTARAQVVGS